MNNKERRKMNKKILGLGIIICLGIAGGANGSVTPRDTIPERAIEIYSKAYTCEKREASSNKVKGLLEGDATVNWVNISQWITPAHLAQGFIDIILSLKIGEISGVDKPKWYMYGDADDGGDNDINAHGNGMFYDLIDPDFKSAPRENIFATDAKDGEYVILRFGLPPVIGDEYKIHIGKGSVRFVLSYLTPTYTDSCVVGLYLVPPDTGVYPCPDLPDVPVSYKGGISIRRVLVNTPITFDCSRSFDNSGGNITLYELDADNNVNPGIDVASDKPFIPYTYHTTGLKKVVLAVHDDSGYASRSNGDVCVAVSSNPLPLWVEVLDTITDLGDSEKPRLYQCAPHPYIPAQCPVANIKYRIVSPAYVTIKIYTFSGDLVKTLVDEPKNAGEWVATWDGLNEDGQKAGAGIYFCFMEAGNFKKIERMVMIK